MSVHQLHTNPDEEHPFGTHKGLPILSQRATIKNGARVMSQTMAVEPFDADPGENLVLSVLVVHKGEDFEIQHSKDDPEEVIGWHRVVVFDMIGAVEDAREASAKALATMRERVAEHIEATAAAKKGQLRLKVAPDEKAEPDPA